MGTASAGWLPQKVVIVFGNPSPKMAGFSFELGIYNIRNTLPRLHWLFDRDPYDGLCKSPHFLLGVGFSSQKDPIPLILDTKNGQFSKGVTFSKGILLANFADIRKLRGFSG